MRKIYTILAAAVVSTSVAAQEDTTQAKQLDPVIVTGQYKPQSVKNSVYQVRTITNQRIVASGAINVQQALNNQLGFRFSNDNTLGTTDVQLMGMSGRNVKILLDGVPLVDRGDTRESLGQVDINSIERIEIVEGPMSVSYGSDALAGVINLISKKPTNNNLSVTARIQEETAGNEYYPFSYKGVHTQNIGISGKKNRLTWALGGTHNDADGFGGDDFGRAKAWRPKEQWLGNARIGYHHDRFDIYYRLDGLNEEISARGPINMVAYTALDQYYTTKRYMHQLQNQWKINEKFDLSTIASYTDYSRRTKTIKKDFVAGTSEPGTQAGQQDVSNFNSFVLRNTLSWKISPKLSLQPGIDINHEKASGARIQGTPVINDYALFVSAEIKPTTKINVRPGLRFIRNSVYDAPPVVPSVNAKFSLSKAFDLRVAYAYGFRSPALRELYFNFVDANHTIIGNPNLEAEHSNSFSGSLSWSSKQDATRVTSVLGTFYNVFNNLISFASSPTSTDTTITVNIDKFKTTGVTLENQVTWKELNATLGFSYIGRYNDLSDDDKYEAENLPSFVWTPEVNTNIIYRFKKINTSIGFFYKLTGKRPGYQLVMNPNTAQEEVQLSKVDAFHWADLTITKPVFNYFKVIGGVKNIFDVTNLANTSTTAGGAHSSGGPVPVSYGRSYFLGLSFQWDKK